MGPRRWSTADLGDLAGTTAIVTGASDGLGLASTTALVEAGANVIMACRNEAKAEAARSGLGAVGDRAEVRVLDVSNLTSIRSFVSAFTADHDRLDLLINNAGVMTPPPALVDFADDGTGIELQWATNHLGHHALTGLLLGILTATPDARVVAVSSLAATSGLVVGYEPTSLAGYQRFQAYANSKLANLVFAIELDRRFRAAGVSTTAVAAHPGLAHTNLTGGIGVPVLGPLFKLVSRVAAQPAKAGIEPILRAATEPDAGGRYFGPSGLGQYRGRAVEVTPAAGADDETIADDLFTRSSALTGVDVDPSSTPN